MQGPKACGVEAVILSHIYIYDYLNWQKNKHIEQQPNKLDQNSDNKCIDIIPD